MTEEEVGEGGEAIPNENYRLLSDEEREDKVIELYFFKGKKYKYISTTMEMSFSTISDIVTKYRESKAKEREREKEKKEQETSVYKVGDDNSGNGDARSRPLPQQEQLQSDPQQQAMIT